MKAHTRIEPHATSVESVVHSYKTPDLAAFFGTYGGRNSYRYQTLN